MEIPESAEGNLGMYIYDLYFEREEPNPLHKEKQKESFRVSDPSCQPSPKKMKTQHEKKMTLQRKTKKEGLSEVVMNGEENRLMEGMPNLPLGMTYKKPDGVQNDEDIIPAATYEPSDSSDEFQIQVNKVFGKEARPSGNNNRVGLARCEFSQYVTRRESVSTSPEKERLTVELFEGNMEVDADKNEGSSTQSHEIEKPDDNNLETMANEGGLMTLMLPS
jgi:hypothetical protein